MTEAGTGSQPSSSSITMSIPILPNLPDPNLFWSQPGPSSLFLLQEARANVNIIQDLKTHIQSGGTSYNLPPPRLPPLPPVPRPSTSTIHPSPTSGVNRPIEKPDFPAKWKGKAKAECLNELRDGGWEAEEKYGGRAIKLSSSSSGMTIWASLREDDTVQGVKVFLEKQPGSRADLTSPAWNIGLSDHLTSLNLSLPELLYRIPHLSELLSQACFYCSKYLKKPDGMPVQHTGFLASKASGIGNDSRETASKSEGGEGRWVCWHDSCGDP